PRSCIAVLGRAVPRPLGQEADRCGRSVMGLPPHHRSEEAPSGLLYRSKCQRLTQSDSLARQSAENRLFEPIIQARQNTVDALLSLGHSVFPSWRQGMQNRPRKERQVHTRGVDAHTPARPLTRWHDVVSAIAAGFGRCHRRAPKKPPLRLNVATDTEVQIHLAYRPVFLSGLPARSEKPTQTTNNLTVTETCAVGLGYA